MRYIKLILSVVFLSFLADCQLCDYFDFCKKKYDSYKVKKFYEKNKNNEELAFFKNHHIYRPRGNLYVVDGVQIFVCGSDTTVMIPAGLLINERSKFYKRKDNILKGEEKEEYIKILKRYEKLSLINIYGRQTDGYVEIEVIPDHIYVYVVDHDSFNLDKFTNRRSTKDLKKIDDSWYYYYRYRPEN
jgi:hypothetical protein